jgi:hypothetical protein
MIKMTENKLNNMSDFKTLVEYKIHAMQYNSTAYTAHLEIPQHVSQKVPYMQLLHLQHCRREVLLTELKWR